MSYLNADKAIIQSVFQAAKKGMVHGLLSVVFEGKLPDFIFYMSVIVSVYKKELENYKDISHQLTELST